MLGSEHVQEDILLGVEILDMEHVHELESERVLAPHVHVESSLLQDFEAEHVQELPLLAPHVQVLNNDENVKSRVESIFGMSFSLSEKNLPK